MKVRVIKFSKAMEDTRIQQPQTVLMGHGIMKWGTAYAMLLQQYLLPEERL